MDESKTITVKRVCSNNCAFHFINDEMSQKLNKSLQKVLGPICEELVPNTKEGTLKFTFSGKENHHIISQKEAQFKDSVKKLGYEVVFID